MIIDAQDLILGRMATVVAKKAILGESVNIINCESVVISGNKKNIISNYQQKRERGEPSHGPHFPRRADLVVKRTIRGMLPYKTSRGLDAFKRVKCYVGIPSELESQKAETIESAKIDKLPNLKYISLGKISKLLGSKI